MMLKFWPILGQSHWHYLADVAANVNSADRQSGCFAKWRSISVSNCAIISSLKVGSNIFKGRE
jgi:hypothetical protein